jgi:hypothetical protein
MVNTDPVTAVTRTSSAFWPLARQTRQRNCGPGGVGPVTVSDDEPDVIDPFRVQARPFS